MATKQAPVHSVLIFGFLLIQCSSVEGLNHTVDGPTIHSILPEGGRAGTVATIHGENLDQPRITVELVGVSASILSVNETELVVRARQPPWTVTEEGVWGDVAIWSDNSSDPINSTLADAWVYVAEPAIHRIVEQQGRVGDVISVLGRALLGGGTMNDISIDFEASTLVQLEVQNGSSALVQVVVESADPRESERIEGKLWITTAIGERVNITWIFIPQLQIASLDPNTGMNGTRVTIYGSGLLGMDGQLSELRLGGIPATILFANDSQAIVAAGEMANGLPGSGVVEATTSTGEYTNLSTSWLYITATVESVFPASGTRGTRVTLIGSNLNEVPLLLVTLDGIPATILSNSSTQIIVEAGFSQATPVCYPETSSVESTSEAAVSTDPITTVITTNSPGTSNHAAQSTITTLVTSATPSLASAAPSVSPTTLPSAFPTVSPTTTPWPPCAGRGDIVMFRSDAAVISVFGVFTYAPPPSVTLISVPNNSSQVVVKGLGLLGGATVYESLPADVVTITIYGVAIQAAVQSANNSEVVLEVEENFAIEALDSIRVVWRSGAVLEHEVPKIQSVTPSTGQEGTIVSISGVSLVDESAPETSNLSVSLSGIPVLHVLSITQTLIVVQAGFSSSSGTGDVSISQFGQLRAQKQASWTYLNPGMVASVVPPVAWIGQEVTIRGSNLLGGGSNITTAFLAGQEAVIVSFTSTEVRLLVGNVTNSSNNDVLLLADTGARVTASNVFQYIQQPTTTTATTPSGCSCPTNQYVAVPCTANSNAQCANLTQCIPGLETEDIPPTFYSDRSCVRCSSCQPGTFETSSCTPTSDAVCTNWTSCTADAEFELYAGTSYRDRTCATCTGCSNLEYRSGGCDGITDSICQRISTCSTSEYQSISATATSDRMCQPCTSCSGNEYVMEDCHPFHNRICAPQANCVGGAQVLPACNVAIAYTGEGQFTHVSGYSGEFGRPSSRSDRNRLTVSVLVVGEYTVNVALEQLRMASATFTSSILTSSCSSTSNTSVAATFQVICDSSGVCSGSYSGRRSSDSLSVPLSVQLLHPTSGLQMFCADITLVRQSSNTSSCTVGCSRGSRQHEDFPCCTVCSDCIDSTFAVGGCRNSSDTQCAPWSECSSTSNSYERSNGTSTSDVECAPCSWCGGSTFAVAACTATDDTICASRSDCTAGIQYETNFGSITSDRLCSTCSECEAPAFYAASTCTVENDVTCAPASQCDPGQYVSQLATPTTDTLCQPCSICADTYEASACTATSDTQCIVATTTSTTTSINAGADQASENEVNTGIIIGIVIAILVILFVCFDIAWYVRASQQGMKEESIEHNDPYTSFSNDEIFSAAVSSNETVDSQDNLDGAVFGFGVSEEEARRKEAQRKAEEELHIQMKRRVQLLQEKISTSAVQAIKSAQEKRASTVIETEHAALSIIDGDINEHGYIEAEIDERDNEPSAAEVPDHQREEVAQAAQLAKRVALTKEAAGTENQLEQSAIDEILQARKDEAADREQDREKEKQRRTEELKLQQEQKEREEREEHERMRQAQKEQEEQTRAARIAEAKAKKEAEKHAAQQASTMKRLAREQREAEARAKAEERIAKREAEERAKKAAQALDIPCTGLFNCECPKCVADRDDFAASTNARNERILQAAADNRPLVTLEELRNQAITGTATEHADAMSVNKNRESITDETFGFPGGFGFPETTSDSVDDSSSPVEDENDDIQFGFPAGFQGAVDSDSD